MSVATSSMLKPVRRTTIRDIMALKGQRPIVCLTAYNTLFASMLDAHTDLLLVGDSLAMVWYGMESTLPIEVEDMIRHTQAVMRGSSTSCIVTDMPFGSYQASEEEAFAQAAYLMKHSGAQAVKLEGGREMASTVAYLSERGIPVMAHIGLKPQHVYAMGGYKFQGKTKAEVAQLRNDARAMEKAGAFALLIEGSDAAVSADITREVSIPTIGIGAGVGCDGQILVTEDMIGLTGQTPKFVQQFAQLRGVIEQAAADYASAVQGKQFPDDAHSYHAKHSKDSDER